jgi:hypothetical protein
VPKTAGSMFRSIVLNNFNGSAVVENPLMSKQVYTADQIESLFYLYPYSFYQGHVFRLNQALDAKIENPVLISFVREPISKALSSYFYLRNRDFTNPNHPAKHKSFCEMVDFVSEKSTCDPFDFDSSQLDWLVGADNAKLDIVKEAVTNGKLLLFPTEKFDSACVILEAIFPNDFRDCSYHTKVNVSERPAEPQREDVMAANKLPWIEGDQKLHDYAHDSLDELIATSFKSPRDYEQALMNFHKRCAPPTANDKSNGGIQNKKLSLCQRLRSAAHIIIKGQ